MVRTLHQGSRMNVFQNSETWNETQSLQDWMKYDMLTQGSSFLATLG
jgi:hypothetical protein